MQVVLARDYGSFLPLGRSAFERLLPELAAWLPAESLQTIVTAYMGHAGYAQAGTQSEAPVELRRRALDGIEAAHRNALDDLRSKLFSKQEIASLSRVGGPYAIGTPISEVPNSDARPTGT